MISEIRSKLFHRFLQKRYGIGKRFTEAYLEYFERSQALTLRSETELEALDATRRMWLDYALSTNWRGGILAAELAKYIPFAGKRYLDIGCGFGGSLVAAAREQAQCIGIEVDAERIAFAVENLADFELDVPVHKLDAVDPSLPEKLGTFDIITCNDVAEHVESAGQLFANMGRMLNPRGMAYLEIPNRYSIDFVARDGHFGLFGITLLDRAEAEKYHFERFHYRYDVGDYWSLDEYFELFQKAGLKPRLIPSLHHPTHPMDDLNEHLRLLDQASKPDPVIDPHYRRYREQLESDRKSLDEETFRNRYLRDFWTFLITPQTAVRNGQ